MSNIEVSGATVLPFHGAAVLRCCGSTVIRFCGAAVLRFREPTNRSTVELSNR
jgi:hypothetical protein